MRATRDRDDLADQARATFACLLAVMDEIVARHANTPEPREPRP